MPQHKVNAYVIRGLSMGETSRVITLFSLEKGKIKCVAKGVRKSAIQKGGALELFSHIHCNIYRKENVELGNISSVNLIDDFSAITLEPEKFGLCSAFCEILDKGTSVDQPIPELYDLTGEIFRLVSESDKKVARPIFWAAFLNSLKLLG